MGDVTDPAGFYEDDEPLEEIEAAFERGVKRITARPERDGVPVAFSRNERLDLPAGGPASVTIAAIVTRTGR